MKIEYSSWDPKHLFRYTIGYILEGNNTRYNVHAQDPSITGDGHPLLVGLIKKVNEDYYFVPGVGLTCEVRKNGWTLKRNTNGTQGTNGTHHFKPDKEIVEVYRRNLIEYHQSSYEHVATIHLKTK